MCVVSSGDRAVWVVAGPRIAAVFDDSGFPAMDCRFAEDPDELVVGTTEESESAFLFIPAMDEGTGAA